MKKWLKYFGLSFFSHQTAKEGTKRGYATVFLGFLLAIVFIWAGYAGADALPFGVHYNRSPDFVASARRVFANEDVARRIDIAIEDGSLKAKKHGSEYAESLLVNTFENEADRQDYSVNGYNVVVDLRPANTPAEVEAYCISNDGKNTVISYEEYLTLSEVARLNFDFKLKYTGRALTFTAESIESYRAYLDGLNAETQAETRRLTNDLAENRITENEYNRAIYELYFANYYPEIKAYESTSAVPLLRNYYYHQYLSQGVEHYLFVFDDYMTASLETKGGIDVSFHGFYSDLENGAVVTEEASQKSANAAVDRFIKQSYRATGFLNAYAHAVNVLSLAPYIAIMIMVVTLLTYSILKLCGIGSIPTLLAMLRIVGSFVWASGAVSGVLAVMMAFLVGHNLIRVLPLLLFFACLTIRSVIFSIEEKKLYVKQSEQQSEQSEV